MEVLAVAAVVLVGAGALYGAWVLEQRRWRALVALAQERGWSLVARDDGVALPGDPFDRGSRRRAEDVLRGEHRGRRVLLCEWVFETRSTDAQGRPQRQVHRYEVVAVALPAFLPWVEVLPENLLTRVLGGGLDLESEEFNRQYRVLTDTPRLAYDVLPPRTMERLLAGTPLALRLVGSAAVSWERGRFDAASALARLDAVCDVLDGVPGWVWADHGGTRA